MTNRLTADRWRVGPLPTTPWGREPCSVATRLAQCQVPAQPCGSFGEEGAPGGWGSPWDVLSNHG